MMSKIMQSANKAGQWLSVPAVALLLAACGSSSPGGSTANSVTSNGQPDAANQRLASCRAPDAAPLPKQSGLPVVGSGPRPGPDILYADAPVSPILSNHDARFVAEPILVQGHEAYVGREYLYQDYLYDDYGSDVDNDDLNETNVLVGNSDLNGLEPRVGDIDYPTNFARYGGNAADLVEFRIAHGDSEIGYRVTLNTLLEADSTITAIAFDTDNDSSTGTATLSRDPGADFAGTDEVIYLWGTGAEHVDAAGNATPLNISTVLAANQQWVFVPRSLHDPQGEVGVTVATGMYDIATGGWLRPSTSAATETTPGVVASAGPPIFDPTPSGIMNLAFRFDEPAVGQNTPPDTFQADRIRLKTPTVYQHAINYADLAVGANRSSVPETGTQVRIYASAISLNPDGSLSPDNSGEGRDLQLEDPSYFGSLQSYSLTIPSAAAASDSPLPLHWALHSNAQEHWQYNGSQYVQQIGEDLDAYVAVTLGRGPRNWYDLSSEVDFFEVWADIALRFNIDANRTAVTGYSMGGFASYRLGTLYPDLFGKAFTQVGPPGEGIWTVAEAPSGGISTLSNLVLENTRHLPYLNLAMVEDELVPYAGPQAQNSGTPGSGTQSFQELGYRYRFQTFPQGEHYTLFLLDNYPMAAEFLADVQVDRNPYHVTFSYLPAEDEVEFGLRHDHAYWVSGLELTDSADGPGGVPAKGTVDAFSHACGLGDPATTPISAVGGIPLPHVEVGQGWLAPPDIPAENRLSVILTNLAAATLDLPRAGLDTGQSLTIAISADSSGTLTLTGDFPEGLSISGGSGSQAGNTVELQYSAGAAEFVLE